MAIRRLFRRGSCVRRRFMITWSEMATNQIPKGQLFEVRMSWSMSWNFVNHISDISVDMMHQIKERVLLTLSQQVLAPVLIPVKTVWTSTIIFPRIKQPVLWRTAAHDRKTQRQPSVTYEHHHHRTNTVLQIVTSFTYPTNLEKTSWRWELLA